MDSAATDAPVLSDNQGASRYELHVGTVLAGFVDYRLSDHDKAISLVHTEIEQAFRHDHLAPPRALFSLGDARGPGLAVLPYCPYITSWIRKPPEYAALVPGDRRGDFG